jgi:hypothetical protein
MDEVIGGWRNCIMRCFISCTPGQILEWSSQGRWDGQGCSTLGGE